MMVMQKLCPTLVHGKPVRLQGIRDANPVPVGIADLSDKRLEKCKSRKRRFSALKRKQNGSISLRKCLFDQRIRRLLLHDPAERHVPMQRFIVIKTIPASHVTQA